MRVVATDGLAWFWIVLLLIACSGETREPTLLPDRIQGLTLGSSTTGEEAAAMIARLHAKSVAPVASQIGVYGESVPPLTLYVSEFPSPKDAYDVLDLMAETIGQGSSGFAHHRTEQVAGADVHYVVGHGQAHYFFAVGDQVLWLAAPTNVAHPALLELLTE